MYFKLRNLKVTLNGVYKVSPFLAVIPPVVIISLFSLNTDKLKIDVYQHDKALLTNRSNELKIVEGFITDYSPESKDGHGFETFTVQGVEFHYSHFEEGRSGHHQTSRYGGYIRPNLYVRIKYYYDGDRNAILKLEVE
jgi:hypothetical protein